MVSSSADLAQELVVRMYSLANIINSTTFYSQYSDLYLASYTCMHSQLYNIECVLMVPRRIASYVATVAIVCALIEGLIYTLCLGASISACTD